MLISNDGTRHSFSAMHSNYSFVLRTANFEATCDKENHEIAILLHVPPSPSCPFVFTKR